ncbi:tetratricopeptide repeat protein [Pedobacter sp. KR3-3]|uniref:Tetratricopeptide repeat protein n=1 Tax=Pedobacter albus TaxID=3113905 RepID=A0ABU7I6I2_9SPHI|nr:tetratricopeptide repeat protein [Pedobacter sp. KR3-3]MEE1945077.1 tetratricopeptide repeat protein [Pedobacter sp. KR3-3]
MAEDKIIWTARFVEGDLNEAEMAEFEAQLQTDAELQQHLKNYRQLQQELRLQLAPDAHRKALQQTLGKLNSQYFGHETKMLSLKPIIKWASGIAAVLAIGLFIWAPWRGDLYQQYHTPGQMLVTERGAASETELDKAAAFYNDGKYAEAKNILEKLYSKDSQNAQLSYYYAQTLLATEQVEQGRELLNAIYNGESAFKYDAAYAMAMSYLKTGQKTECKTWLQKIAKGTTHYQKATDLIQKL